MLGLLAGIIGVIGYAPYIRDILKGSTKPDRASWLIWTLEYAALFGAQLGVGAAESLWLVGLQLLGVVTICILSYWYGAGGFDRKNTIVLLSVCVVLAIWYFTRSADLTVILLVAVEAVGAVLTMRKVYKQPGSETLVMWALIAVAGGIGIVAVGSSAAAILYVYPVVLITMGLGIVGASKLGERMNGEPSLELSAE